MIIGTLDLMKTVSANGIRFAYIEEGEGPLVLLLHGFPDTAHTWDHARPRIAAKGYRAVSPFMRGYSPTEAPPRDAHAETLARDTLALIDALGAKDAILVGHDWGAAAVYGASALGADRVRKLIAVGIPHPATLKPSLEQIWGVRHFALYKLPGASRRFARDDLASLRHIYRRWSPTWSPSDEEFSDVRACFSDRASLDAAFGYYRALTFTPPAFMRTKVAVPTVVFSGNDDPNTSRKDYERGKRMFTGDYVIEEMPGGHFLHREHPDEFASRLLSHL